MKSIIAGLLSVFLLFFSADSLHAKKKQKTKKSKPQKVALVKRKALSLLTLEQVASLSLEQRIKYLHYYQQAAQVAEQMSFKIKKIRDNYAGAQGYNNDFWNNLLGTEEAFARGDGSGCIVYGGVHKNCKIESNPEIFDRNLVIDGVKVNRKKDKKFHVVRCGNLSGLKGSGYEYIDRYDSSPGVRDTAPHGTYAGCGGVANALRQRITHPVGTAVDPDLNRALNKIKSPSRRNLGNQIEADRLAYNKLFNEDETGSYQILFKETESELVAALRKNDKAEALEVLTKRKKALDEVKHLGMIHVVKAHTIRLAADYKKIAGSIPADLDTGLDVLQFNGLAAKQKTINDLSSGDAVGDAELIEIGFNEAEAIRIAKKLNRLPRAKRIAEGKKILFKFFGLKRSDGIYSNFNTEAGQMDGYFGEAIRLCMGESSLKKQGRSYNPNQTRVACSKEDPNHMKCEQFNECLATIRIEGGNLVGGEFKSVMDAYIKIRDPLTSVCHTLPSDDPEIPLICTLDNDTMTVAERLPSAQVVDVPKPKPLVRNESYGCEKLGFTRGDPITRSTAACAVCALQKDGSVPEMLKGKTAHSGPNAGNYLYNKVSTKWLTLLEVVAKGCGATKKGREVFHVEDMLNYSQVFGHCTNKTYSWRTLPDRGENEFIRFLQTEDFTDLKKGKRTLKEYRTGWDGKNYEEYINKKTRELFGFPLLASKSKAWWGSSSTSKEGLVEMFCSGGHSESPRTLKANNFHSYAKKLKQNGLKKKGDSAKLPENLRTCMDEAANFARTNYHPGIDANGACYSAEHERPVASKEDTKVVKIAYKDKDDWRCGYSEMYDQKSTPSRIYFYNIMDTTPSAKYTSDQKKYFATVLTTPRSTPEPCPSGGCAMRGDANVRSISSNKCLAIRLDSQSPAEGRKKREAK